MLILSFDAATAALSVALLADGDVLDTFQSRTEKTHSERLMPAVDQLLRAHKVALADIGLVAVGRGPGSYTGIRIAVATALGLTNNTATALITVSTLQAMTGADPDRTVYAVLDARGGRVFAGGYRGGTAVGADRQTTAAELADHLLETRPAGLLLAGNGAPLVAAELAGRAPDFAFAVEADRWPDAAYLGRLGLEAFRARGGGMAVHEVRPFYAAPTQAERLATSP